MKMPIEPRYAIKFYIQLRKAPTETLEMVKTTYQDDCSYRWCVFEYRKKLKEACNSVSDEPCGSCGSHLLAVRTAVKIAAIGE